MKKIVYNSLVLVILGLMYSCTTDSLDPSLEQNKEGSEAVETSADVEGILRGAYNRMTSSEYYGRDYLVTNEVRTPNTWANGSSGRFTTEAGFAYNPNGEYIWDNAYAVIANANIIINTPVDSLSDFNDNGDYTRHMQGQAYAIRALCHFDLLKTYGQEHVEGNLGIPYVSEFKGEDIIPARESIESNRTMLFEDINTAFELMDEDFFDSSKEFMSKYTAKAIESRMAIWFELWEEARSASLAVIESEQYSIIAADQFADSYASGSSSNSIFELAFNGTDNAGINGLEYIYRGQSYGDISVTPNAFNDLYDDQDIREEILGTEEVGSNTRLRNMAKFPERSSNVPLLRYEEVILNYAEALFELGQVGEALTWLNSIPENRNATTYEAVTKANILLERRKEFLFEGLYYWDLQRTQQNILKVDSEQNIDETVPYGDNRRVHPIPYAELDANSSMEQNPGYN